MVKVYTDGAYSPSRNQGGWAFVVLKDDEKIYSSYDVVQNTTNNRMEIQSVIEAIKYLKDQGIKEFTIHSDSMYVIGTMTLNWSKKKNTDLWIFLEDLITGLDIKWKHTKGHNGDKWNEYCDMLAVHGSKIILNEE